jgi:predicted transcriptional regulator
MFSKKISMDILFFFIKNKNLSIEELSKILEIPTSEIKKISNPYYKSVLSKENVQHFLDKTNMKQWELIYQAIPPKHLTEEIRKKIELCKIVSDRKKRKK